MVDMFKIVGRFVINTVEANDAIDDVTKKADNSQSKMTNAFKKIGSAIATYFATDKIIEFGKEIVNIAAEVSAEASAFEQIMGDYSDEASDKVSKIADATGIVDTRLVPYMTSMSAKFKGLGYDITDATDYAARGLNLAADASAFWDKSLDESMSHLNSFINGSYEGGEAIGLFANDTQLAAYAVKVGLVDQTKDWSNLEESIKQATRLEYAENMMKMSGATGQAAKESDQYANVQANLSEKWRQFKSQIGEPLLQNIVIPAMDKLSGIVDTLSTKFEEWKPHLQTICENLNGISNWISEHQNVLTGLAVVIGVITTALGLQSIAQGVQVAMNATETTTIWGLVAAKLASAAASMAALAPYILIVAAIAAVIAIIVVCVKHWDEIKAKVLEVAENIKKKVTEMKDKVANTFAEMKEKMMSPIVEARDKIKDIVEKIKSFFSGLQLKLPDIKMPHFKISGSFSLSPPETPNISVEWYAKAMNNPMLLDEPTIFGYNPATGQFRGGGEAGQEVVSGTNTLMGMIGNAVESKMATQTDEIVAVLIAILEAIVNGNSELLQALLAGQKNVIGEREFGRLVRKHV